MAVRVWRADVAESQRREAQVRQAAKPAPRPAAKPAPPTKARKAQPNPNSARLVIAANVTPASPEPRVHLADDPAEVRRALRAVLGTWLSREIAAGRLAKDDAASAVQDLEEEVAGTR